MENCWKSKQPQKKLRHKVYHAFHFLSTYKFQSPNNNNFDGKTSKRHLWLMDDCINSQTTVGEIHYKLFTVELVIRWAKLLNLNKHFFASPKKANRELVKLSLNLASTYARTGCENTKFIGFVDHRYIIYHVLRAFLFT